MEIQGDPHLFGCASGWVGDGVRQTQRCAPILKSRCVNSHDGERVEEGLLLRTYEELMAGSANGPVIVPGDPENSLLVQIIVKQKMPNVDRN